VDDLMVAVGRQASSVLEGCRGCAVVFCMSVVGVSQFDLQGLALSACAVPAALSPCVNVLVWAVGHYLCCKGAGFARHSF